jgi:predicted  nucleic acid-binding Zn-ribbon protein
MDDKILKEKKNKKILVLQKHLQYFRCQAVRLEKERRGFVKEIENLKKELDAVKRDKKYFESFVIQSRQENENLVWQICDLENNHREQIEKFAEKRKDDIYRFAKELEDVKVAKKRKLPRKEKLVKPIRIVNRAYGKERKR